jgi:hygromycin-B 4-O-kinase
VGGTVPSVAVPSGVDEDAALAIVRRRHDPGCATVERIGEGEWSRCFAFVSEGCERVIRIGAHRRDFEKDRLAADLARHEQRLPVPAVLGVGEEPVGAWCISTRAHGTPLEQLDTAGWERALPSLLDALAAMEETDLAAHPGWGQWDGRAVAPHATWAAALVSVDDGQEDRVRGWRRALAADPTSADLHRRGTAVLHRLAATLDPPRRLLHADLTNRNVLVEDDRVTAVLDWGEAHFGDPLYEIAGLEVWAPWYPAITEIGLRDRALAHMAARGADLTDADERIRAGQIRILLNAIAHSALLGRTEHRAAFAARLEPLLSPGRR